MLRIAGALAALIGLTGLAGCGFGASERVYALNFFPGYSPQGFSAYAAGGAEVEIIGAPPGGATPQETAAALKLPAFYRPATFRPVEPGGGGRRLVIAFAPGAGVDGFTLCRGEATTTGAAGGLSVAAAFCRGSRPASSGRMVMGGAYGPGDPEFTASMRRFLQRLAPRRDPNEDRFDDDRDRCVIPPCA